VKELRKGIPYEVELESWTDLRGLIDNALEVSRLAEPAYLFRGQSDSQWTLMPSLAREVPKGIGEAATRDEERTATTAFQSQAHQFLTASSLPQHRGDLVNWWVSMQHYGAVTRLLDWTESPYVATYFAVAGREDVPGALWIVHVDTVLTYMGKKYPDVDLSQAAPERQKDALWGPSWPPALIFFEPHPQTERMSAQQTHFSLSPMANCDHKDLIAPAVTTSGMEFVKVVIPAALKLSFKRQLRFINVTARSLFPGIDGLGRSVTELIRLRTG
jgi:FRG domain